MELSIFNDVVINTLKEENKNFEFRNLHNNDNVNIVWILKFFFLFIILRGFMFSFNLPHTYNVNSFRQ